MIFPWQKDSWQKYVEYLRCKRLIHAILVSGPPAIGKMEFCLSYIQRMNCLAPVAHQLPCGVCESCHLISVGTHPDVRLVNVDKGEGAERFEQIKVDDIRKVSQFMSLSCQYGRYKTVCINQADRMNINAANALLKTLEEPPSGSVLFLVSDRADCLPATVKSRCQIWNFAVPDSELALQWLQEKADNPSWQSLLAASGGRPLLAWELHNSGLGDMRTAFFDHMSKFVKGQESVTEVSRRFQNESTEKVVSWLQSWCGDLIRYRFNKSSNTFENMDMIKCLRDIAGQMDLQAMLDCMERLAEARRIARAPLNRRLLIEDMLIQCRRALRSPVH